MYHQSKTKLDYAVEKIKELDAEFYATDRKVLDLGNSTWNLSFTTLCGEFFYECLKIEYHLLNRPSPSYRVFVSKLVLAQNWGDIRGYLSLVLAQN